MKIRFAIFLALLTLVVSTSACGNSAPAGPSSPVLSSDKAGSNKTTTFAPTDTVYLSYDFGQPEKGTSFDIKWFALDVTGQDPTTPFFTSNVIYDGTGGNTLYAQVNSSTGGFPVGKYNVEIDTNGTKTAEQQFAIQ